jgi:hypothetical protein
MSVDIVNSGISVNLKQEYVSILLAVMSMLLYLRLLFLIFSQFVHVKLLY